MEVVAVPTSSTDDKRRFDPFVLFHCIIHKDHGSVTRTVATKIMHGNPEYPHRHGRFGWRLVILITDSSCLFMEVHDVPTTVTNQCNRGASLNNPSKPCDGSNGRRVHPTMERTAYSGCCVWAVCDKIVLQCNKVEKVPVPLRT